MDTQTGLNWLLLAALDNGDVLSWWSELICLCNDIFILSTLVDVSESVSSARWKAIYMREIT